MPVLLDSSSSLPGAAELPAAELQTGLFEDGKTRPVGAVLKHPPLPPLPPSHVRNYFDVSRYVTIFAPGTLVSLLHVSASGGTKVSEKFLTPHQALKFHLTSLL